MKKFKKNMLLVKTPNVKLSTVYERTIKLCYFWLLSKMFLIGRTSWKHSYLVRQSNDNCNLPKIAIIIIPNYPLTVLSALNKKINDGSKHARRLAVRPKCGCEIKRPTHF